MPSGAKTIVKTMEFPRGKFASGASTIVKTKHSRWRREPQNGVCRTMDWARKAPNKERGRDYDLIISRDIKYRERGFVQLIQ